MAVKSSFCKLALIAVLFPGVATCSEYRLPSGRGASDVFTEVATLNLARAACEGDEGKVEAVVNGGANPNGEGAQGFTVLAWAVTCDNPAGVEALLRAGADPNKRIGGRLPPAFIAVTRKKSRVLALLLKYGADPNALDEEGNGTLLMAAFESADLDDQWQNYELLLRSGSDVSLAPNGISTVATVAANVARYDKVVEILRAGYSHDLPDLAILVRIPWHPSQEGHRKEVVRILNEKGVKVPGY